MQQAKGLSEEALQITEKRREAKGKGEKERYTHLNAEFQRIARRDKKAILSDQCKETEEHNRMGPRLSAGRRESGSQRPWLGEAAPQPEGSSVCAQKAPARLGTQLYLTHCDPMDSSTSGLPVHYQLPELTQTHVH